MEWKKSPKAENRRIGLWPDLFYAINMQVTWIGKTAENPEEKTLPLPASLAKVIMPTLPLCALLPPYLYL